MKILLMLTFLVLISSCKTEKGRIIENIPDNLLELKLDKRVSGFLSELKTKDFENRIKPKLLNFSNIVCDSLMTFSSGPAAG